MFVNDQLSRARSSVTPATEQEGRTSELPKVAPHGIMKPLYATDPEGYGLCFQWPVAR
jgi:hypothetical protein